MIEGPGTIQVGGAGGPAPRPGPPFAFGPDRASVYVGARRILMNHPGDILEVEMESNVILKDIDTPEEYRECAKHAEPGDP